jgi:hypothetical protein
MLDSVHPWSVVALIETPAAWFLGLLLGVAAAHKLLWRERALAAVRGLTGMPAQLAAPAVSVAAGMEVIAAIGLLVPAYRSLAALLAALLWSLYFAALARALLAGRRAVDCGCSFGKTHRPLGSFQLLRTATLAAVALALAAQPAAATAERVAVAMPVLLLTQALCALALLALYAALDSVMSLGELRAGALR